MGGTAREGSGETEISRAVAKFGFDDKHILDWIVTEPPLEAFDAEILGASRGPTGS
jgi:hypothetical protein